MSRRQAVQAGVFGALGLSLGDMLKLEARAEDAKTQAFSATASQGKLPAKALSVIQLHLGGGVPQQESFDPKPEAPVEYRGSFGVTKTKHGDVFSDNFPMTAAIADKLTVIRSMVGRIPDHQQATYHLFTGYTPTAVIDFPQMGAVVSHELGNRGELPPYIAIPNNHSFAGSTGFLSSTFAPFDLNADPGQANFKVRDFSIPEGVSNARLERRKSAREIVEKQIRQLEADPTTLDTMDDFYKRAYTLLTSSKAQAAFTLDGETEDTMQLYGRDVVGLRGPDNKFHPMGLAQRLIMARRLVEAGTRFVTVTYGSWDSHVDTRRSCLDQMPALDHAIAGMITDLEQRGMLDTTLFWVTTEFGRTPKVKSLRVAAKRGFRFRTTRQPTLTETLMPRFILMTLALLTVATSVRSEDAKPITYDDHIAAIFKRHCWQCHVESKQESGLNLASYAAVLKGGSGGVVVDAGRSSGSRLFQAITAEDADERMPPENDALPKEQVALIKTWIDTGLKQNSGSSAAPTRTLAFTPSTLAIPNGPPPMPEKWPVIERVKTARPYPVLALAASPRAPLVAVASYEQIDFIDPATRDLIGSLPFPEGEPHVLRFNRLGSILLAAGGRPVQSGAAVLFDVKTGQRLAEIGNETDVVLAADLSADERHVAIGGSGRVVKVFSTEKGSLVQTLVKHTEWITAIAYSPDGKLLATGDRVGNIHLWDAASGGVVLPLSEHKASVRALAWRSDSQVLASCGEDGLIVWWEVAKGWPAMSKADAHPPQRPAGDYGRIASGVLDVAFGPQGELITCGRDRTVRVWSSSGAALKSFSLDADVKPPALPSGVRILPLRSVLTFDGATAITGDSAGRVHAWPIGIAR